MPRSPQIGLQTGFVIHAVAGSNPVVHPSRRPRSGGVFAYKGERLRQRHGNAVVTNSALSPARRTGWAAVRQIDAGRGDLYTAFNASVSTGSARRSCSRPPLPCPGRQWLGYCIKRCRGDAGQRSGHETGRDHELPQCPRKSRVHRR